MKTLITLVAMASFAVTAVAQPAGDVPIGGVIDWWRPNATFPVPAGFQVADGSTVTDARSPLAGTQLPDLRNKFIRGANDATTIGQTGGAAQHTHSANPPAITFTIGAHRHEWGHTYLTQTGQLQWLTWDGSGNGVLLTFWNNGIGDTGSGHYPLSVAGTMHRTSHFYTGETREQVQVPLPPFTTGSAAHEPPYVGLLKIIRVR